MYITKQKNRLTDIENKLVNTSGEAGVGRAKVGTKD